MLLSVNIRKFRSCNGVKLSDMQELLTLIGRNGVGKTNILKAIEWAAGIESMAAGIAPNTSSPTRGDVVLRMKLGHQILRYAVAVDFDIEKAKEQQSDAFPEFFLKEELAIESDDGSAEIPIFTLDRGNLRVGDGLISAKIGPLSPGGAAILALYPDQKVVPLLKEVIAFLSAIRYYPLEEIEDDGRSSMFVSNNDFQTWVSTRSKTQDANKLLVLKILDMKLNRPETFGELLALLGPNGLGLISNIPVRTFEIPSALEDESKKDQTRKYHFIEFAPSGMDEGLAYTFLSLSFGTRRIIRLVTSVLYDDASVSLIEQPEDGIHHGLLHKIIPLLRSYANPKQFLVTSHSTAVFNRIDPSEIRLVDLAGGQTTIRSLTAAELSAAERFMENDGPLSEFIESVQEQ